MLLYDKFLPYNQLVANSVVHPAIPYTKQIATIGIWFITHRLMCDIFPPLGKEQMDFPPHLIL